MNFLNHLPKEPSAPATLTNTQQLVKEWRGNKIYNDTTATGTDAAVAALKTFPNCVLIAGGQDANFDYHSLAEAMDKLAKRVCFLEGGATEQIKKLMKNQKLIRGTFDSQEI